ncbi:MULTISPECIES: ferredoxin family protein [Acidiplasma]|jgi:ferredoxin like protein|uniref:Ferredoxin-like protein n=2 Tax=Acidiplasma TaxID=507753 RepID=A0A0Q0RTW9_9ARCH|nr:MULTISPECIES: 4Fe-4S dicluster domain-containing protein [Acidiplasma]KJE50008.1 4Fe-4S ferredoxin [Acidiplasma sp. MBA-1]KPV46099.1 4Fe-4S ferredoxin [Acidiplasma aeolicum]KQB33506.1 4Fe-4S ferredoxin [Acidiplasma cupricumulans]KQB33869.1 4Fe-4S ferredoxin [Acidiplasma aeolicum]WMT55213.1 MAG: 4Fe-4S dicluster domain-containing protein [Acidiplasma sp.]
MRTEEKLYTLRYKKDEKPHLSIRDSGLCLECEKENGNPQPCILICPAGVYTWEDKKIVVGYENCVECGACRIACPYDNINWEYPRFGRGIALRYA